ncbi:MAG: hypothetical protein Q8P20_00440 [bacterium]|nr:hypothetical protein [bacterium]
MHDYHLYYPINKININSNDVTQTVIDRDRNVITLCCKQLYDYNYYYAMPPIALIVGWKIYFQLKIEFLNHKEGHSNYINNSQLCYDNGILYLENIMIIADPNLTSDIRAIGRPEDFNAFVSETESVMNRFKNIIIEALKLGIGVNELRKNISLILTKNLLKR